MIKRLFALSALGLGPAALAAGLVTIYPAPAGKEMSTIFTATVAGQPLPIYVARVASANPALRWKAMDDKTNSARYFDTAAFGYFDLQGRATVTVTCSQTITGGTFASCAAAFKAFNPAIRRCLVEPAGAAILAVEPVSHPGHRIQGGGYAVADLPLLNPAHVDGYLQVSDAKAVEVARRLAREEGIFAGYSSGANPADALRLLRTECPGQTVAVVMCDSGLKHLSSDLWEAP